MKETFELIIFKDGHQVAIQDITTWTAKEVEKLLLIQERQGRTWKYRKSYEWEEVDNEK